MELELEKVDCNLCGSKHTKRLFEKYDNLTNGKNKFPVVQCTDCGLAFVNPRPKMDDMHVFYPKEFLSYQLEIYDEPNATLREKLISFIVKSSARQRVKTVQKLVKTSQRLKVLDIGCGKGSFLYALQEMLGWEVSGIDFDKNSVDYCNHTLNLNVIHGGVDNLEEVDDNYDLITMWHFFEHDYNPLNALKKVNQKINTGQYLLIEVPNAESLENKIFGKNSFLYDVPRHLYNFSPETISKYLSMTGFEIQSIRSHHFSGGWLGSVQNVFFNNRIYTHLKSNIYLFLVVSMLLAPLDLLLSLTKKGSVMTVMAKKVADIT